jgi:hypothetical protein
VHPLDRVGVDVRGGHLDGGGQVDDHRALGGRLEDVQHRVADPHRELQLGAGVRLGAVLVEDLGARDRLLVLLAQPGALHGDVDDAVLVLTEHHLALEHRRGVVQVHDRLLGPGDGLVGALDQVLAGLRQHLDHHVVGDAVLVDQLADEVEVGLRGGREADLDLLVAHLHEQLEHRQLAGGAHRLDQGLVAVTQVDRAPARGRGDLLRRPGAVRQLDPDLLGVRAVLVHRHAGGLLGGAGVIAHRGVPCVAGAGVDRHTELRDEDPA